MAAGADDHEQPLLPSTSGGRDGSPSSEGEGRTAGPAAGPPPKTEEEACAFFATAVLLTCGVIYYLYRHYCPTIFVPYEPAVYNVTIAAVSGLDPATDLHRQQGRRWLPAPAPVLLEPAFNLTVHVAMPSSTRSYPECIEAGTVAEMSYLRSRVPLAAGPVPELCVAPGEEREEGSVVAWGEGVRLPGFVLDSLAADLRAGAAEFGVRLVAPLPYCGGSKQYCRNYVKVISCWAKIGGGAAPCDKSSETVSFPAVPRPGKDSPGAGGYLGQTAAQ